MLSYSRPIERCQPLLGTFVRIRVEGLAPERAHAAIDSAFDEIAQVHRLMSFHAPDSDVSRLNREASTQPVSVDVRTYAVLARAAKIARHSDGAFDITVAPELVARGLLPAPAGTPAPDAMATWRDIQLLEGGHVQFTKPLWIDLGGIAKGYAVDRAVVVLQAYAPVQACVNAGGDLRVIGANSEHVRLAPDHCETNETATVEIENGSLASSCGSMAGRRTNQAQHGSHIDARRGRHVGLPQFVSVAAPLCIDADALTKVVMTQGTCSAPVLEHYGARALVHDAEFGWRAIGEAR